MRAVALATALSGAASAGLAYDWAIPDWLPPPPVPGDVTMSDALVDLGRHLFYDQRLSADGTMSCASCHEQALAFTDGRGMWARVIELVGGDNIARAQIENRGPLNPEYVLSRQPEVILQAGSECLNRPEAVLLGFGQDAALARERMAAYTTRSGWADLRAVQSGDVYGIYHGGNRTLSVFVYARAIAKTIYPEAFSDVDLTAELAAFYDRFLPVAADGVFVVGLR
ncbi:MAG: cytochrome c peroxidase [Pararhodobacter sp.]